MATQRRERSDGLVIHSDRGVQFTSWAFSQRVRENGLAPSMGAVGSAYDNSMMESFWGRMQVELLNRHKWKTRIELATAIHDYIELWHNTRRRHSALGMLTPTEIEDRWFKSQEERLLPKTGPDQTAEETLAAGLSKTRVDIHHSHQDLLLNNNNHAA